MHLRAAVMIKGPVLSLASPKHAMPLPELMLHAAAIMPLVQDLRWLMWSTAVCPG